MRVTWRQVDFIDIEKDEQGISLSASGCHPLEEAVSRIGKVPYHQVDQVIQGLGHEHQDILIKEALLKATDNWQFPYTEEELCHCRMIPAKVVDEAIIGGLHTAQEVGRFCSAGITCGNCGPDVQAIIDYRLK
tara:strand:+ start:106 stop:504 length:399 start_codon:yes stop_codon:yes gene_type:complete